MQTTQRQAKLYYKGLDLQNTKQTKTDSYVRQRKWIQYTVA